MIYIEIVCDGCTRTPWGESYGKGSLKRLKAYAKQDGWKTIKGKIYCPRCQQILKAMSKVRKTR